MLRNLLCYFLLKPSYFLQPECMKIFSKTADILRLQFDHPRSLSKATLLFLTLAIQSHLFTLIFTTTKQVPVTTVEEMRQ